MVPSSLCQRPALTPVLLAVTHELNAISYGRFHSWMRLNTAVAADCLVAFGSLGTPTTSFFYLQTPELQDDLLDPLTLKQATFSHPGALLINLMDSLDQRMPESHWLLFHSARVWLS